jgi:branched-chain amino acid transport system substrate-binding protein
MRSFAALLAAVVALLAAPRSVPAATPFEIDAILPLTGQNAFLGHEELEAFQIAEDLVNKSGGIRGRQIKFVIADDQTNPQNSVQLANQIIAKHAAALLGLGISASCKAVIPLVERTGPLTFCFTPAVDLTPGSFVFSSTVSTTDTVAAGVQFFREHGWTRLAVITSTDATGQDIEGRFASVLARPENKNVQVVAREHFNTTDISVSAQMARIKAANPQAMFSSATGTPFGTLLHGISDAGLGIPVYTNASNMTVEQMTQYAQFLPRDLDISGMMGMRSGIVGPGPVRDAQTVFFKAIAAHGLQPSSGLNLSWDAIMIVLDAYRHLGLDATAAQLHDYVEHLQGWAGINGIYRFQGNTQRGVTQNSIVVFQWNPSRHDFVAVSKPGGRI